MKTLPEAFQGEWDQTADLCGDPDAVKRLNVSASRLTFYEWGDDLTAVHVIAPGSIRFESIAWSVDDVDAQERPIPRPATGQLKLSEDGDELTFRKDGHQQTYVRCRRNRL